MAVGSYKSFEANAIANNGFSGFRCSKGRRVGNLETGDGSSSAEKFDFIDRKICAVREITK